MARLACMTLPYARYPFERALAGIAQAGFHWVSFGLPHAGIEVPDEGDPAAVDELRRLFDRYGLRPVQLVGTRQLAPGQPLERARRRIELAIALGIEEILSVGTWGYTRFPDEPLAAEAARAADDAFVEHFRGVAAAAEAAGVQISLKPHTGNTATAEQLRRTLARIGSPAVKASYDPGNVRFYEGVAPEGDVAAIAGETISLIAKDHRGPRAHPDFPIPGEGEIDFRSILATLRAAGFDGPIVVERIDGTDRGPLAPEEVDRRIATARRHLEAIAQAAGLRLED